MNPMASQPDTTGWLAAEVQRVFNWATRMAYAHVGANLNILSVSDHFARLMPDSPPDPVGRPLTECAWELAGLEAVLRAVARGQREPLKMRRVQRSRPDGSVDYFSYEARPLHGDAIGHLLFVIQDVTEAGRLEQHLTQERNEVRLVQGKLAQANEELNRLNALKSLMLSMAAHDMRSPLTAIRGYSELLQRRIPLDERPSEHEFISSIWAQSIWLDKLIANLLDFDRIEQGRLTIDPIPCDLTDILTTVQSMMEAVVRLRQQALTLDAPAGRVLVDGDPDRLQQVFHNLVSNAIKYTPEGGAIAVRISSDDDFAYVEVADNGPGIAADALADLFEPYERTEEARRSHVAGTGLGLYIVKMLTEAHQGAVQVRSEVGQGTTFTVSLPLSREDNYPLLDETGDLF